MSGARLMATMPIDGKDTGEDIAAKFTEALFGDKREVVMVSGTWVNEDPTVRVVFKMKDGCVTYFVRVSPNPGAPGYVGYLFGV